MHVNGTIVPASRRVFSCVLSATLGVILSAIPFAGIAQAHDSWINRGGFRNGAGELCCGEGDCFPIPAAYVEVRASGYLLKLDGVPELVPFHEALPSADGAFRRCRRPDGGRRCFFAPAPSS